MSLSLDRQRRVQAGRPSPFHQLRDVVEPTRRGRVVVAQRLQGRAQFPGRLTTGLQDRQQGRRHLFAPFAGHVDGDFGLHLDDRDLVGERIVQLPRDVQPLLVGAAPRGLLPGPLRFLRPPLGLPQRLTGGTGGAGRDQPGDLEGASGLRERLARVVQARGQGGEGESGQHDHARRHRDGAVPRPYGGVHREQVRDSGHVETGRLVTHRAHPGDGQDENRRPAACGQRQAARHQQRAAEQVEVGAGALPEHPGDQQRHRHADGDHPVCDACPANEPSCAHARTLTGCSRGQLLPTDGRPPTAAAVLSRLLRRPR